MSSIRKKNRMKYAREAIEARMNYNYIAHKDTTNHEITMGQNKTRTDSCDRGLYMQRTRKIIAFLYCGIFVFGGLIVYGISCNIKSTIATIFLITIPMVIVAFKVVVLYCFYSTKDDGKKQITKENEENVSNRDTKVSRTEKVS